MTEAAADASTMPCTTDSPSRYRGRLVARPVGCGGAATVAKSLGRAGGGCYSAVMRRLVIAVLLLSCAGDETRRAPEPRAPESRATPTPTPTPTVAVVARREPAAAAVDPREATRKAAHDVLAEHCGECHEGHRSNAPKALAVFDLDLPDWPSRFDEHRFASALQRLAKKPAPASLAFVAFRDAELAVAAPARAN